MATKTQFLPYAHRYQDATAGLRDALTSIQTGMNQRGTQRILEADQKIRQGEADRLAGQRSFLAGYQPTLSEEHLTNEGLERYNSLIEHNQDRLSAMDDNERETVRQKLLRETADAGRVARTVREDVMRSGFFDPKDVDTIATSYGSGYTDYATAAEAAYKLQAEDAKNRASMFKDATSGLGNVFGKGPTGAGTSVNNALQEQESLLMGLPDKTTGRRPNFDGEYNSHKHSLPKRLDLYFHNDPDKERKIGLLQNRGLVTYQKNALTKDIIDDFVKTATADGSLGRFDNKFIRSNVEEALKTYYDVLDKTGNGSGGRVAAPPAEVLRRILFDGVKEGGFLTDRTNTNAQGFFTSGAVGRLGKLFEDAHAEYLESRESELQNLLGQMAGDGFDFHNTPYAELNQEHYGEQPPLNIQQRMLLSGRTGAGGPFASGAQPAQAPQRQAATNGRAVFNTEVDSLIQQTATDYGIPVSYLNGLVSKEAGWDGAVSPTGATGIGQMVQSTWNDLAARPEGKAIGMVPVTKENFRTENDPRKDNAVNLQATALLTQSNAGHLARAGVEPTSDNLYMVHNMGTSIIPVLAGENPGAKFAASVEKNARHNGKRADETIAEWVERQKADYRSHEARRGGSELAAAMPRQQAGAQLWTAAGSLQQQGHPATEHLRALLDTYPQPYTEKSFTYDKIDATFRRLGLTVPAAQKVKANTAPVAAGFGAWGARRMNAPVQQAPAASTTATPAVTRAGQESEEDLLDRQLRRMDSDFLARREADLTGGDYGTIQARLQQEQSEREIAQMQANARATMDATNAEIEKNYRKALREYEANRPVQGDLSDILWRAGPGEAPINFGPFIKIRHLPTDRNTDPFTYDGPGTARSAWEQTVSELYPSTQNTEIGLPQTAAPERRFSPPMLPEPVRSLPEQREGSSNNFLMMRQDRQQELRDLIDSRTNQGISAGQSPEQEAAMETAGASGRYEMLADIIREFQQAVGNNQRMTLGNIV